PSCASSLREQATLSFPLEGRRIRRPGSVLPGRSRMGVSAPRARRFGLSTAGEEAVDHLARRAGRALGLGVEAAPARADFGDHFLAAADQRLVERPRAVDL